ncbi:ABC transporter ATP-binding protein [Corynebacterium aquilae]|uniref:ABC transporter ATP-binding protein n=1 Tax=Corynebacterium aquilae TaxID=203263 RepID=UPI001FEBEF84|nr:ABC transporter ATP-binding protein [Corynebacterium aquilae]
MRQSLRFLSSMPHAPRWATHASLAFAFGVTLVSLIGSAWLTGRLVDVFQGGSLPLLGTGEKAVIGAIIVLAVSYVADQLGRTLGRYVISLNLRQISVDLRQACLKATLAAPIPRIMELGTGNVMTRLTKDIDDFVNTMGNMAFRVALAVLMFPASLFALGAIDLRLLIPFVVLVALVWVPVKRNTALLPQAANVVASREGQMNNILLDSIRALPTIKSLGLHQWAHKRLQSSSWRAVRARLYTAPIFARLIGYAYVIYGGYLMSVIALAGFLTYRGIMTPGQATAAVMVVMRMEMPIFNAVLMLGRVQEAFTSLGRAVSLAKISEGAVTSTTADITQAPEVIVDHVTFGYQDGPPIMEDITLTFAAGTTTAIVGASGAGKSTLASIIAGINVPTSGTVRVGDVDTATVSDEWTARHVTLMSQEVHIFSGTLRDDLLLAKPGASDEQLLSALHAVGLSKTSVDFMRNFPEGLDTRVGTGAEDLPAAIEQQLSLARVLLVDPPVLIMDEATSEAGSDAAKMLESAAQEATKGRTSIVIAHRLDQAAGADRIIVMDQGAVIEDGTHQELLDVGGSYARLYSAWAHSGDARPESGGGE